MIKFNDNDNDFLINAPIIKFFEYSYKRYTNFAIESKEDLFDGDHMSNEKISYKFPYYGDLINKIYIKFEISQNFIDNIDIDDIYANEILNIQNEIIKYDDLYILSKKFYEIIHTVIRKIIVLLSDNIISYTKIKNNI
jgi:hypothetical protein